MKVGIRNVTDPFMKAVKRVYYNDINYKPFLFYVVFGASGDELQVSREKHHVDEFPKGLNMQLLCREKHSEYIDGFFAGSLGSILKENDSKLFEACKKADKCVVIRGEVEEDSTLDYLRNVIGFVQALVEQGACGVLDLLTFSLFEPTKWTERFFEKEINAQNHVVILSSKEEDRYWLHTRGMAEFGRPDISIKDIEENFLHEYKQIIDQMIFYGGQGAFFDGIVKLHIYDGKTFVVEAEFINDYNNDDFNNAYYEVVVFDEVKN